MTKELITPELAAKEVESWLDYKKVKTGKRENLADQISILEENVCDGTLVLDDKTHKFTHKLQFPIENSKGEVTVKEIIYKPRLKVKEINAKMTGVKANDADGRVIGYVAALTEQPVAVISNLDTEDNSLAQAFAMFFL